VTVTEVALRAQPHFRRYLAARVMSTAGRLLTAIVLPVLVYRLTGSIAWTAAAVVAQAVPHLLFALPAAVLVERWDRRFVLVGADVLGAAALATVPLAWIDGDTSRWHVLAVGFAVQALLEFADAADRGALPVLAGEGGVDAGHAAVSGATTLAALMVPPLAGLAAAVAPLEPLIGLAAVTVLASALLVRAVARPLSAPARSRPAVFGALWAGLRGGIAVLRARPAARAVTLAGVAHAVAGGAWFAMLLPWADLELGVPPRGDVRLGLLVSCWAIGALAAGWLTPLLRRRYEPARLTSGAMLASLAGGLGVLACTHWLPAVLVGTLWGVAYWIVVLTAGAHRRALAVEPLRSRVDACGRMLVRGVGYPAGAVLAAVVGTMTSPRGGLAAALAVLALGVLVGWRALRAGDRTASP